MISPEILKNLNELKSSGLVVDIETSSHYSNGEEINIRADFENYVSHAKVKWVGFYSYRHKKYLLLDAQKDAQLIMDTINEHSVLITFNGTDFDLPILKSNGYISDKKFIHVDLISVLGTSNMKTNDGYPYKNRGAQMGYKFKRNSLKCIGETMNLDVLKGDIDYAIFHKNSWTEEEQKEIKVYLKGDIGTTKEMFDVTWAFWLPFAEFLEEKFIYDLSWIRNSIASLTYKSACKVLNVEPTYSDKISKTEEMGGRVIEPLYEEAEDVWYIDFASLYPHIFSMFNLFSEVDPEIYTDAFHGNNIFKVKGHYDITHWNPLAKEVSIRLKQRMDLKKNDPKNPLIYALKIWLNALYGCARSAIFEKVHTKNCGWDCCWLGQQIQEFTEEMMHDFGFETIAGDTDSLFVRAIDKKNSNREYVKQCLDDIIEVIKNNVPFPVDTFKIDIENHIDYIMFPFSEQVVIDPDTGEKMKLKNKIVKTRKGLKKNYVYLYKEDGEQKIEIKGLSIKKDNATPLGMKVFKEVLQQKIIEEKSAKFSKVLITDTINNYLENKEILKLLAVEYRVNASETYKKVSQIQAQISRGYFNGQGGTISLIKNLKTGNAGLGTKYCTVEEAIEHNLTGDDLDLTKIYNELEPFIRYEESEEVVKVKKVKTKIKKEVKKIVKKVDKVENKVLYSKSEASTKIMSADMEEKCNERFKEIEIKYNDIKDNCKNLDWD